MAVPFYVPEQDEHGDDLSTSSQSPNTTTSATQTPLQSPVNGEHLVQAFCEALYRCSINGSPAFQFPPPSPSCSVHSPIGSYTGGDVFFPRGRSTPRSPRNSFGDEIAYHRQQLQQQQQQQQQVHQHQYQQQHHHHQLATQRNRHNSETQRRSRLTSTGDDYDDEHECHSEHETSWDELDDRYENFTAARERLQEFNGRIPPRKKKKDIPKSKPKSKEQSFTWPTVVTVFVFAMGCGFLVAR